MTDESSRQAPENHESPEVGNPERRTADPFDLIDTASEQSFPASDPPSWAGGQLHPASPAEAVPLNEGDEPPDQIP
ncbi:MAG: hypothetical protein M3Z20_04650 [Chloroflexota bacterium]|nr:hypothetical protein [Chloroflexota bacterium]